MLDDEAEDVPLLVKVNTHNISDDDLGSNKVSFSFLIDWYERRVAEDKSFIMFKVDDNGTVYSSVADCSADIKAVKCTTEFSGEAGGFSVFGLSAVLDADDFTPSPTAINATPTQESIPVVPGTPSIMTPTPVVVLATPTPVTSVLDPVEEMPTLTLTPESKATPVLTPGALAAELGNVTTEATPATSFSQNRDSPPTPLPAEPMVQTPGPVVAEAPTIEDADAAPGDLILPIYVGIVVGLIFALVGGAAYVYKFKPGVFRKKRKLEVFVKANSLMLKSKEVPWYRRRL